MSPQVCIDDGSGFPPIAYRLDIGTFISQEEADRSNVTIKRSRLERSGSWAWVVVCQIGMKGVLVDCRQIHSVLEGSRWSMKKRRAR